MLGVPLEEPDRRDDCSGAEGLMPQAAWQVEAADLSAWIERGWLEKSDTYNEGRSGKRFVAEHPSWGMGKQSWSAAGSMLGTERLGLHFDVTADGHDMLREVALLRGFDHAGAGAPSVASRRVGVSRLHAGIGELAREAVLIGRYSRSLSRRSLRAARCQWRSLRPVRALVWRDLGMGWRRSWARHRRVAGWAGLLEGGTGAAVGVVWLVLAAWARGACFMLAVLLLSTAHVACGMFKMVRTMLRTRA